MATATEPIATIYGVVEQKDGSLLLNDGGKRRIIRFNRNLDSIRVVVGTERVPYPRTISTHLFLYLGDTAVYTDYDSQALVQIAPDGTIGRSMALPKASDLPNIQPPLAPVGIDAKGRLVYPAPPRRRQTGSQGGQYTFRDTTGILVADFETRDVDTIGYVTYPVNSPMEISDGPGGKRIGVLHVNPSPRFPDQWVVTSDGVIAIVNVNDYTMSWHYADGRMVKTGKMPIDWRRITDGDKQAMVDSARHAIDSLAKLGRPYGMTRLPRTGVAGITFDTIVPTVQFVSLAEIPDYFPAVRIGGMLSDVEGNVWLLPYTSLAARGGLLYDIVTKDGQIVERVQLPGDRAIAGFGANGVVYLRSRDSQLGVKLEKATIER